MTSKIIMVKTSKLESHSLLKVHALTFLQSKLPFFKKDQTFNFLTMKESMFKNEIQEMFHSLQDLNHIALNQMKNFGKNTLINKQKNASSLDTKLHLKMIKVVFNTKLEKEKSLTEQESSHTNVDLTQLFNSMMP